jgi:hypothetical protein
MQSYVERNWSEAESKYATKSNDDKMEITELGKETVYGHSCVKNKAIVMDKQGDKHEFIVWNATDLKNFPIKIEMYGKAGDWIFKHKDNAEAVVTDQEGDKHGFGVNAADLKNLPGKVLIEKFTLSGVYGDISTIYNIKPSDKQLSLENILKNIPHMVETNKVETDEHGYMWIYVDVLLKDETYTYKDITLSEPDASLFEPPSDFTKYDSMQAMIQQQTMKRIGGGMGFPLPKQ